MVRKSIAASEPRTAVVMETPYIWCRKGSSIPILQRPESYIPGIGAGYYRQKYNKHPSRHGNTDGHAMPDPGADKIGGRLIPGIRRFRRAFPVPEPGHVPTVVRSRCRKGFLITILLSVARKVKYPVSESDAIPTECRCVVSEGGSLCRY